MTLQDIPDDWQHGDVLKALGFVKQFDLAIDCGAHRGVITRLLVPRFRYVVAIEPSDLADMITGAEVIKACVGDQPGECAMADGKYNTGQRHVVAGAGYSVITLDSLNLAPDFIKLDVEGMEWHALKGGEQTIKRYKPVIMLEENELNRRYGVADGEPGRLLQSWGARRVLVTRQGLDEDWIYAWS